MKRAFVLFCLAGAMSMLGCSKQTDNQAATDTDTISAEDHSTAEVMFNDLYNVTDETAKEDGRLGKVTDVTAIMNGCATVTVDTTGPGRSMIIDFGTGCTGNDGRLRAGKIKVTLTGRYRDSGTVITIKPDGYSVNGNKIEGTKTVTNLGRNALGHPSFKIKVSDGKITTSDNKVILWESERVREWIKGYKTQTPFDDEYQITGSANGTNRNGKKYTAKINDPLVVLIGCRWIESGNITITPEGKSDRTIDYGNGTCDDKATVTINGKTYTITMR